MHKLIVFDLDGTLAKLGKGMEEYDRELLRKLEKMGYTIAICSGKPCYYLCGFMRQVEIEHPILVGENGAAYMFGVDLPPKQHYIYPYSERAGQQMKMVRTLIDEACEEPMWYQPNEIAVTPFPESEKTFEQVQQVLDQHQEELDELVVYRHVDSFDITPKVINKGNGMAYLTELLQIEQKDVIAVGDWLNDVPMFEYADCSIRVGNRLEYPTDYAFDTITEALEYMIHEKL